MWGHFTWKQRPDCRCGELARAVEAEKVFVSRETVGEGATRSNRFYILPVSGDGFFAMDEGLTINCCPWCGDGIIGLRG